MKAGDEVYVKNLKRFGVIKGELRDGIWEVFIGGLCVQCRAADFEPVSKAHRKLKAAMRKVPRREKPVADTTRKAAAKVDLHGMRVEDALRAARDAMDRAILADVDKLEIVHGLGTGAIREALHKYLAGLSVVASFRLDDQNPGVTWVYF